MNRKVEHLATKEELSREIGRMEVKIESAKSDIIKWMFIFWIGQVGAVTAILMYFLAGR